MQKQIESGAKPASRLIHCAPVAHSQANCLYGAFADNRAHAQKMSTMANNIREGVVQREKIPVEAFIQLCRQIAENIRPDKMLAVKAAAGKFRPFSPLHLMDVFLYLRKQLAFLEKTCAAMNDADYNALLLSTTVNIIAESLAMQQTIPQMIPNIAIRLVDFFTKELASYLAEPSRTTGPTGLDKVRALCSDNPIELYAKNILPLPQIVRIVNDIARKSGITPLECIDMLCIQLLARVSTLTQDELENIAILNAWHGNIKFTPMDVYGFISVNFKKYIQGDLSEYVTEDFKIKESFTSRIGKLKAAFEPLSPGVGQPASGQVGMRYPRFSAFVQRVTACKPEDIPQITTDFEQFLLTRCKVCIGVPYSIWFGEGLMQAHKTHYQSMPARLEKKVTILEMLGEKPPESPKDEFSILDLGLTRELQERSDLYPAWRVDKDVRGAGKRMQFSDFPVYGYLCYWNTPEWGVGGSSGYGAIHFTVSSDFISQNPKRVRYKGGVDLPEYDSLLEMMEATIDTPKDYCCSGVFAAFWNGLDVSQPGKNIEIVIYGGGIDLLADMMPEIVIGYPTSGKDESLDNDQQQVVRTWGESQVPSWEVRVDESYDIQTLLYYASNGADSSLIMEWTVGIIKKVQEICTNHWLSSAPAGIRKLRELPMNKYDLPLLLSIVRIIQERLNHRSILRSNQTQSFYACFSLLLNPSVGNTPLENRLEVVFENLNRLS